nr:protein kinase [Kofleriaceae bacterium]
MPEAGIKFGQYVLLRRIARGGMAEVFLAQQRGLEGFDRRVAVKRILPHLADSPDFVKMFLGEARLAAQLTHPNVVHIYDFGKVDGDYFIAMEYVDGVHAGQLFKLGERGTPRPERLPPTLVARIGADAASALYYAHELRGPSGKPLGLVHRDVSPANLMVSFDGTVKLCDFGIAKAAALSDQLTNPGQVKGKYAYMSPEQTVAAPLDGRSDVFSLAIVLWELLAGKTIVPRGDTVEAMRAIRDGKLERLDHAAPGTPKPLVEALQWALETRRDKRATASDLAQALEGVIKSSPELATPMHLAMWLRPRVSREQTDEHQALTGAGQAAHGTLAAPGTMAAPATAGVTPQPELIAAASAATRVVRTSGGGLIAASRMPREPSDEAETLAMGPPSELHAALAQRQARAERAREPARRASPSVIVDADLPRVTPVQGQRLMTVDADLMTDSSRDPDSQDPRDTTFDDAGDRDRTRRRDRDDLLPELDADSSEDDIVDTFERRGNKLREQMGKRASPAAVHDMPQVVHAIYSTTRGEARLPDATQISPPPVHPHDVHEAPTGPNAAGPADVTAVTPRPPAMRRKLPEPTRPPPARGRTDVMAAQADGAGGVPASALATTAPMGASPLATTAPMAGTPLMPGASPAASLAMTSPVARSEQAPAPVVFESATGDRSAPYVPAAIPAGDLRTNGQSRLSTMATPRRPARGPRVAIAIAVLAVVMVVSFLIALSTRHRGEAVRDAGARGDAAAMTAPGSGSASGSAAAMAATGSDREAGSGSGSAVATGSDASAGSDAPTALLEVSTSPGGASVVVGDQTRVSPTRFALAAGTYTLTATLPGYEPETREVELLADEHVVKEIAFAHKLAAPAIPGAPPHPIGYLSARTQPYSDVYEGGKLLGQTPLAEVALAPGTYTLTFKNPAKGAITRRVTITAGKTTKLQFDL